MAKLMKVFLCGFVLMGLPGCFETDTVVKVKSDGSGTIEQKVMLSKELTALMRMSKNREKAQIAPSPQPTQLQPEPQPQPQSPIQPQPQREIRGEEPVAGDASEPLFPESETRSGAARIGQGVTYVSRELLSDDSFEGYKAIYSFTDINTIKLNPVPADSGRSGEGDKESAKSSGSFVSFRFTKGTPSTLVIEFVKPKKDMPSEEKDEVRGREAALGEKESPEATLQMMKSIFRNMEIKFSVDIEGSVVDSDASYLDGSRITLLDVNFQKLVNSVADKELSEFESLPDDQKEETLRNVGCKVESKNLINVVFN